MIMGQENVTKKTENLCNKMISKTQVKKFGGSS